MQPAFCNICCDTCDVFIKCPFCPFDACMECQKTFILSKLSEPTCMECQKKWSIEFVMENFETKWAKFDFLHHMTTLQLEQEKMLLPTTQGEANEVRYIRSLREQVKKLPTNAKLKTQYDGHTLQKKIKDRNELKQSLQAVINNSSLQINNNRSRERVISSYVMRCNKGDCRGYVTAGSYKCETCNEVHCERCKVVINQNHVCRKEDLVNAREIENSTRPCPKCYASIYKDGGCDQIWCPQCHTAFSYSTGKIDKGPVHNPVFYEYLASNPSSMPAIMVDNIACGDTPSINTFMFITNQFALSGDLNRQCVVATFEIYRYKSHIENVILPECSQDRVLDNIDLRVKYLNNDISEKQWMSTLLHRQKKRLKLAAIEQLFNTIILVINDILRKIYADINTSSFEKFNNLSYHKEFEQLLQYKNDRLDRICKVHGGTVPYFKD